MNVVDTKGLLTQAVAAIRGPLDICEHHSETCEELGYMISEEWAEISGLHRLHLCEAHRVEFWEVFVK